MTVYHCILCFSYLTMMFTPLRKLRSTAAEEDGSFWEWGFTQEGTGSNPTGCVKKGIWQRNTNQHVDPNRVKLRAGCSPYSWGRICLYSVLCGEGAKAKLNVMLINANTRICQCTDVTLYHHKSCGLLHLSTDHRPMASLKQSTHSVG